jgi:hypothetical protein
MESVAEMWRWAAGLQAADEALRVGLAGRGMGGNGASDSLALLRKTICLTLVAANSCNETTYIS